MISYIVYAKIFGLVSTILALGILFNLDHSRKLAKKLTEGGSGYIMAGVLPIIFGSWVVTQHIHWVLDWPLVVTLIGWGMLLIGIYRVLFVSSWMRLMEKHRDRLPALFALFGLMFGLLLLYVGFASHHFVALSTCCTGWLAA